MFSSSNIRFKGSYKDVSVRYCANYFPGAVAIGVSKIRIAKTFRDMVHISNQISTLFLSIAVYFKYARSATDFTLLSNVEIKLVTILD